jgi:hypothetical protein
MMGKKKAIPQGLSVREEMQGKKAEKLPQKTMNLWPGRRSSL